MSFVSLFRPPRGTAPTLINKVILIVWILVIICALMLAMIYVSGGISEGVRSYVRGQALWARAKQDAVHHLKTFTYTYDPQDYARFLNAIAVIEGDRQARLALSRPEPDLDAAKAGFTAGKNHPEDIDDLISFYLFFGDLPYMREAVHAWEQADTKINQLIALGDTIAQALQTEPDYSAEKMAMLRQQLNELDAELSVLEKHFADVLSEAARHVRTVTLSASAILTGLFLIIGVYASLKIITTISRDIAEKEEMQTKIRRQAREDPLTGLSNRADFYEKLSEHIKLARREDKLLGLLYLDLDLFKPVNDTYGHTVGDAVLQAVAAILMTHTRETDVVARFGGDEFVILLVHPKGRNDISATAQRIINGIQAPQNVQGHEICIGVSIGIAVFPDDDATGDHLIETADAALYAAKKAGRGTFRFFTGKDGPSDAQG